LAWQNKQHTRVLLQGQIVDRRALEVYGISPLKNAKYSFPRSALAIGKLKEYLGDSLEVDPEIDVWYNQELQRIQVGLKFLTEKATNALTDISQLNVSPLLQNYQKTMVNFGNYFKRLVNGDDRGLGKTFEALSTMQALNCTDVIVICPGYIKFEWEREIAKWTDYKAFVTRGEKAARKKTITEFFKSNAPKKMLVVNYEMVRISKTGMAYPELFSHTWDMIISDEAHRLKGRQSQWTQGVKQLSTKVKNIQLLTGNFIDRVPEDMWQLLNILDPVEFSSYWAFVDYFCVIVDSFFGREIKGIKPDKLAELQMLLVTKVLFRSKAEVASNLPEKIFRTIDVELEGKQKTQYKLLESKMIILMQDGNFDLATTALSQRIKLQQLVANPKILNLDAPSIVNKTCLELVDDIMESSDKIIVATWFVPAADILEAEISKKYKVERIKADLKDVDRDKAVQRFKTCKEKCVLVGTIKVMSEGINADECDHIIFCDKSWVPKDNEQLIDRIHRMTSTRTKNYYEIVVKNTIFEDRETVLKDRILARDAVLGMKYVLQKAKERKSLKI
jgi:SNF2 family DNA or RNA helicase